MGYRQLVGLVVILWLLVNPAAAQTLTIASNVLPELAHPYADDSQAYRQYRDWVYSPLLRKDAQQGVVPALVRRWQRVDQHTYHFWLATSVSFHSGKLLNSDDIIANWRWLRTQPQWQHYFGAIQSITAISPWQFEVKTQASHWQLLEQLSDFYPYYQLPNGDFEGTGPYQVESFIANTALLLKRFRRYQQPSAYAQFERLHWLAIHDPQVRLAALQGGDVDMVSIDAGQKVVLPKGYKILTSQDSGELLALVINQDRHRVLQNITLRQAIAHALPSRSLVGLFPRHLVLATGQLAAADMPGYLSTRDEAHVHPSEARKHIRHYGQPLSLSLLAPESLQHRGGVAVRDLLSAVGIHVRFDVLADDQFLGRIQQCDGDMFLIQLPYQQQQALYQWLFGRRDSAALGANCLGNSDRGIEQQVIHYGLVDDYLQLSQQAQRIEDAVFNGRLVIPLLRYPAAWAYNAKRVQVTGPLWSNNSLNPRVLPMAQP